MYALRLFVRHPLSSGEMAVMWAGKANEIFYGDYIFFNINFN